MTRISEKKAIELGIMPEKKHKYNARKTIVDGIPFDSKREADYYCELKLRVMAGEIKSFEIQPEYMLQEAFTHGGKKYRAIKYRGDFKLVFPDGRVQVVDTKGYRTREYINKKKMLLKRYPDIEFLEA